MNTVKEETQIKSISEIKLGLVEWILKMNEKDISKFLEIKNQFDEEDKKERQRLFLELAGSWQSDETGTELADQIYKDRNDYPRELDL